MDYELTELENIQNFILGGKADFVINDRWTGEHIEFKVKYPNKENKSIYYVYYKSIDWIYIGTLKIVIIGKDGTNYNMPVYRPKGNDLAKRAILVFGTLIKFIYYIEKVPNNIQFLYTGICSICGRKLTDPSYIKIGIGPICLDNQL